MPGSITGVAARNALLQARALGADIASCLAELGVATAEQLTSEIHIPAEKYAALWQGLITLAPEPCLPILAGLAFDFDTLELYGFLTSAASSIAEAYEYGARYRELYNVGSSWELSLEGSEVQLEWRPWALTQPLEVVNEYQVAEMLAAVGHLLGSRYAPAKVCFRHPCREGAERNAALLGCPIEYEAAFDGFIASAEVLTSPLPQSNSALLQYLTKQSEALLAERRVAESHAAKVRDYLLRFLSRPRSELGQLPTQGEVAKALGLSPRSLQRRLEQEGALYSRLLDDVRKETALRSLQRESLAVSEVAYLLGFNDPSAFFKAFKRWTGQSPREYRAALRG